MDEKWNLGYIIDPNRGDISGAATPRVQNLQYDFGRSPILRWTGEAAGIKLEDGEKLETGSIVRLPDLERLEKVPSFRERFEAGIDFSKIGDWGRNPGPQKRTAFAAPLQDKDGNVYAKISTWHQFNWVSLKRSKNMVFLKHPSEADVWQDVDALLETVNRLNARVGPQHSYKLENEELFEEHRVKTMNRKAVMVCEMVLAAAEFDSFGSESRIPAPSVNAKARRVSEAFAPALSTDVLDGLPIFPTAPILEIDEKLTAHFGMETTFEDVIARTFFPPTTPILAPSPPFPHYLSL